MKEKSSYQIQFLKLVCLSLLTIFFSNYSDAQNQANIWYFGDKAGLSFNNGEPEVLTDGKISTFGDHNEGSSVIADDTGNLLFYSDGERIWNKNHAIMPNGNGILGHQSSTNAAFIVPLPLSSRYFYMFTADSFHENDLKNGLRYSVIDMCLDDELGDVMPNQKNILIEEFMTEKIAVARHTNGVDYWIVTHKYKSNNFYIYLLTPDGLETEASIISIGAIHEHSYFPDYTFAAIGQMKISPNGKKLALCFSNTNPNVLELFDFDTQSGELSRLVSFADRSSGLSNFYGIEFSLDNSKLYFSTDNGFFQTNLNAGNGSPEDIVNSIVAISGIKYTSSGMQLASNGKIYISNYSSSFLSSIENPNALGVNCNYVNESVNLGSGVSSLSLPSFIANFDYSNAQNDECDKPDCEGTLGGTKIEDECGECLEPDDPEFNSSCMDCAGTVNGNFVLDDCGECLSSDDPNFNSACMDCAGTVNGNFVLDNCGECLSPDDPDFNNACVDCAGTVNGNFVLDDCGECLSPDAPEFNSSCLDCAGTLNGSFVLDDCGECLSSDDPEFNNTCMDCAGLVNGSFVLDDCGECLSSDDPEFNNTCVDCAGTINGSFILDDCGTCLSIDDPDFMKDCLKNKVFIPNAFSPNGDAVNNVFEVKSSSSEETLIKSYLIFNRYATKIYEAYDFDIHSDTFWWDGSYQNVIQPIGVYLYLIEVEFKDGTLEIYKGNVTLVR